jgi:Holliday junction resolvase
MKFAKIDANQPKIVAALRKAGAFVQSLATIGKGCPDIMVGYKGAWYLMEIKDGDKEISQRKLKPDEMDWILKASRIAPVHLVETEAQALAVIGQN